jgi:hypothetical protein
VSPVREPRRRHDDADRLTAWNRADGQQGQARTLTAEGDWSAFTQRDGTSINQFINSAVAEQMSALLSEEHLAARSRRRSRKKFDAALKKVPDVEPHESDRLDG